MKNINYPKPLKPNSSASQHANRILDMMNDYSCSMKEALEWDIESFEYDLRGLNKQSLKVVTQLYLLRNGYELCNDHIEFYTSVMLGTNNFVLKQQNGDIIRRAKAQDKF